MTQEYRWLACDGYTIERDGGQRILLHDLHTLRGSQPPLRRLGRAIGRWLLGLVRPAGLHCVAMPTASLPDRNARASILPPPPAGRRQDAASQKAA